MNINELPSNFKGKSFLKLLDFTTEEINIMLDVSAKLKAEKKSGIPHILFKGKTIALLFEKNSTRTRCAFEIAAYDLGMNTVYLDPSGSQMGKKESIEDTAKVLGRTFDGIEYRGFGQENVDILAKYSGVPVWNGLTNEFHPTQVLADLLTIKEHYGSLKGKTLVFMGDARFNMGNSLMVGCSKMGMNFVACTHPDFFPGKELTNECKEICKETGGSISFTSDVNEGVKNADVIYTDVWVSMGESPEAWKKRIENLLPYRVTKEVMQNTNNAIFMHCLPSFHDLNTSIGREIYEKFGLDCMEVTDEVFTSPQSVVFDEAENRMHTIKAVMALTL